MNCNDIRLEIDEHFDNNKEHISSGIKQHIANCPSCAQYFDASLLTNKLSEKLKVTAPFLSNSDKLTDDILNAISNTDTRSETDAVLKGNENHFLIFAQRFFAAASVCLFLVFGAEQFIVVNKITTLENKLSGISAQATITANNAQFITIPKTLSDKFAGNPFVIQVLKKKRKLYDINNSSQKRKDAHD